jgi:vancomycin resistance protein YoaR
LTRLTSFFTSREVGVAARNDPAKLNSALDALRPQIDRAPVEGGIHFDMGTAQPVEPKPGQKLDGPKAVSAVLAGWVAGKVIDAPVTTTPVAITADAVRTALDQVAVPAVSGPVTVNGEGKDAKLEPAVIAQALTFEPNGSGGLNPKLDQAKIVGALTPQLASTEQPGADAEILIQGSQPVVKASQDGRSIDYDKMVAGMLDVLRRTDNRTVKAQYAAKPAKVTTDQANQLGVKEVIGEFSTGGFAHDSGVNIQKVAEKVNGAIVKPGDTFSLNGYTGPRMAAQGYVDAGIILNGAPARAVGGGISQFATTLYNASYFAGMTDAGHQEHSYYISRYPPAREATVFENPDGNSVIDIKFKNDGPTGVVIQTIWTPSSITVRLWGTKRYQVESIPGEKTDFTEPNTITKHPGEPCVPGNGAPGFKTTDTRVLRDLSGREVRRDTRTKRYDPVPKIVCSP